MIIRKKFTILELLIVISIIMIIAALLLPALNRAREKAKQGLCMSNLRQTGIKLFLYIDSNDGWAPSYGNEPDGTAFPYLAYPEYGNETMKRISPAIRRPKGIYYCPNVQELSGTSVYASSYVAASVSSASGSAGGIAVQLHSANFMPRRFSAVLPGSVIMTEKILYEPWPGFMAPGLVNLPVYYDVNRPYGYQTGDATLANLIKTGYPNHNNEVQSFLYSDGHTRLHKSSTRFGDNWKPR